jgi:hypothetical protein
MMTMCIANGPSITLCIGMFLSLLLERMNGILSCSVYSEVPFEWLEVST